MKNTGGETWKGKTQKRGNRHKEKKAKGKQHRGKHKGDTEGETPKEKHGRKNTRGETPEARRPWGDFGEETPEEKHRNSGREPRQGDTTADPEPAARSRRRHYQYRN